MATNELARLVAAVERQTAADGAYDTAVPALRLCMSSAPSHHDAVTRIVGLPDTAWSGWSAYLPRQRLRRKSWKCH